MPAYEIRLRRQHGEACAYRANRTSDFAAIRTACSIAAEADAVEVWKGMDCIYVRDSGNPSLMGSAAQASGPLRMNA